MDTEARALGVFQFLNDCDFEQCCTLNEPDPP